MLLNRAVAVSFLIDQGFLGSFSSAIAAYIVVVFDADDEGIIAAVDTSWFAIAASIVVVFDAGDEGVVAAVDASWFTAVDASRLLLN